MSTAASTAYTFLVTAGLLLNGIAVACAAPLGTLLEPLRDRGLLAGAVVIDLVLVPTALLVPAALLGVDDEVVAGLVLLAAASSGPIGVALTRIARGDVPATVSIVAALGAANLLTVPLLMGALLPGTVDVPTVAVGRSLLVLLVIPLAAGVVLRRSLLLRRRHPEAIARTAQRIGAASSLAIAGAAVTGLVIDPGGIAATLAGPAAVSAAAMLLAAGLGAVVASRDAGRRRSLWLTATARSVGVALAVAALHLPDAEGTRATVLAIGGATQVVPVLMLLGRDRWAQRRGRVRAGGRGRLAASEDVA